MKDSYFTVHSFMVSELKLKGNDLLVYALIYSFYKQGKDFDGSLGYLQEWTNATKKTVITSLESLNKSELILKSAKNRKTVYAVNEEKLDCLYKNVDNSVENVDNFCSIVENSPQIVENSTFYVENSCSDTSKELRGEKITPQWCKNYTDNGVKITPNNNIYNNNNKVSIYKKDYREGERKLKTYDEIFLDYGVTGIYRESLLSWIRHCLINKVVLTNERLTDIIVKLDLTYFEDDQAKALCVSKAISRGYKRLPVEE